MEIRKARRDIYDKIISQLKTDSENNDRKFIQESILKLPFMYLVNEANKMKSDQVILNSNENHAEYAISEIFKSAEGAVNMYGRDFSRKDDKKRSVKYISEILDFLYRDVQNVINAIIEVNNEKSETLNLLKYLSKSGYDSQINLSITDGDKFESVRQKTKQGKLFHFTTVPNVGSYRFEHDIEKKMARINFNNSQYANRLSNLFNDYKLNSKPL